VASLEGGGEKLVLLYYLTASKVWPDKRCGLRWEWLLKRGTNCTYTFSIAQDALLPRAMPFSSNITTCTLTIQNYFKKHCTTHSKITI
jgi:hypothetical protein